MTVPERRPDREVADDEITAILAAAAGAQHARDLLVERALHRGGRGNIPVVVTDLHAARARCAPAMSCIGLL